MAIPPLYIYFITTVQLGQGKKQFLFVKNKHTKQKRLYKNKLPSYNVTKPTAKKYILTVKDKILKEINKHYDNLYY
jgi:hypothetical protein